MSHWRIKSFHQLSKEELYAILRLRNEVFIVEQNCVYQDLDNDDQKAFHLFYLDNDNVLAYARLFPENIKYKDSTSIGRVVVSQNVRLQKMGKELMQRSINFLTKEFPKSLITISAQSYLLHFYKDIGFQVVGEEYLEDDIPHCKMIYKAH